MNADNQTINCRSCKNTIEIPGKDDIHWEMRDGGWVEVLDMKTREHMYWLCPRCARRF